MGSRVRGLGVRTSSSEETRLLARKLAEFLEPGAVLALDGHLGAGKTTFAQGLAQGLDAREGASSPTFVLLHVHQGRLPMYHFDAYRLERAEQLEDLGADEYLWGSGVSVIEWAERVAAALPQDRLEILIERPGGDLADAPYRDDEERELYFTATGPRHARCLDALAVALEKSCD